MSVYCDTGILMKLYLPEPESAAVAAFVRAQREPILLSALHRAEMTSALQLKGFRGEARSAQIEATELAIEADIDGGVYRPADVDWESVWKRCRDLARLHASETGCRTLDTLHVACAIDCRCRTFATLDARQRALAERAGLRLRDPLRPRRGRG